MDVFNRNPQRLLKKFDHLKQLRERKGRLEPEEVEAMAECAFRLAVHYSTPPAKAASFIRQAFRLDRSNPKYAYHAARLYFTYGKVKEAQAWFALACRLCPTSHRIWAHIGLLQWELNAEFHGDDRYTPDSLRKRGNRIVDRIRAAGDHFDPTWMDFQPEQSKAARERKERKSGVRGAAEPERGEKTNANLSGNGSAEGAGETNRRWGNHKVRRSVHPNQCRWSGIKDAFVERELEGKPNQRTLEALVPLMEELAQDVKRRRGGVAGFAILSIQWILSGYPVETINRLLSELGVEEGQHYPSLDVLKQVCELYQASEDELPELLAAALVDKKLPPILVAAIHRRRLLWRPLEYRGLMAYRQAKRLMADFYRFPPQDDTRQKEIISEAADLSKRLKHNLEQFRPEPPKPLRDRRPKSKLAKKSTPETIEKRLAELEAGAEELLHVYDEAFRHLRELIGGSAGQTDNPEALKQAAADHSAFRPLIDELAAAGKQGIADLKDLGAEVVGSTPNESRGNFVDRFNSCENQLKKIINLGNFERQWKKIGKRLIGTGIEASDAPSKVLASLLIKVQDALPAEGSESGVVSEVSTRLESLEEECRQIGAALNAAWEKITQLTKNAGAGALDEAGRKEAIRLRQDFDTLMGRCAQGIGEAASMRASVNIDLDELTRLNKAESELLAINGRRGAFRKRFKILPSEPTDLQPEDAAAASRRERRNDKKGRAAEKELTGITGLAQALSRTRQEINQTFAAAERTFDSYPDRVRRFRPISRLRASLRGADAVTWYRLGDRRRARQIWNDMLREDRLDSIALKSIAICDTFSSDVSRQLASWKAYTEMLYFYNIVNDESRRWADPLAELHCSLGSSFAPKFLIEKHQGNWEELIDQESTVGFIKDRARVRAFIDHRLLEFLNRHLAYRSPHLVLGVTKQDRRDTCSEARNSMVAFARHTCSRLPDRVAAAAEGFFVRRLDASLKITEEKARKLSREEEAVYGEEKARHFNLLCELAELKFRIFRMLNKVSKPVAAKMDSVDFLGELNRLDMVPLNQTEDFGTAVAGSYRMEPAQLIGLMKLMTRNLMAAWFEHLFAVDDAEDVAEKKKKYDRIAPRLASDPIFEDVLVFTEHPGQFYSKLIQEYREEYVNTGDPTRIVGLLREWHNSYPGFTGVSRDLAGLLQRGGRYESSGINEAIDILDRAAREGLSPFGRHDCELLSIRLKSKHAATDENFDEAIKLATQLLEMDFKNPEDPKLLLMMYREAALHELKDPGLEKMKAAVDAWLEAARNGLETWKPSERQPNPAVTEALLQDVEKERGIAELEIRRSCIIGFQNQIREAIRMGREEDAKVLIENLKAEAKAILAHPLADEELRIEAKNVLGRETDDEDQETDYK